MAHIFRNFFTVFKFFKYIFNRIFDGAHFSPVSAKSLIISNKHLTMVYRQIFYWFLLFKIS